MKIAITADPFIPVPPLHYGGIERIIDMLIDEYCKLGYEVTLIAHPDSSPNKLCRFIPYTTVDSNLLSNSSLITKSYFKYKFDIIHSFSRLIYLLPLLPLNVPKLMSYQREPTLSQIKKAMWIARKGSLHFTGCSNYISNQIATVAPASTVYNGVSMAKFNFNNKLNDDAPLVFLGRIEEIKGTHLAIKVAIETGNKLIIAGNIPEAENQYFEEQVKPYLSNQIEYIGMVNDIQKNELLQSAKAFLMPILWNEPFGIVMAEAMACGTPVIGLNRGSVPEVVNHGVTGFVCDNVESMISAVKSIHAISRLAVRKDAENRFSQEVISNNYINLYKKLV